MLINPKCLSLLNIFTIIQPNMKSGVCVCVCISSQGKHDTDCNSFCGFCVYKDC
jgi:hypothetical protein